MPGLGHKSYLQIGPKETTFGTFQTPTSKLELINWSVDMVPGIIEDPSLYDAQSWRGFYPGGNVVRGTFLVSAQLDRSVFRPGSAAQVSVRAVDYLGVPRAGVPVTREICSALGPPPAPPATCTTFNSRVR